MRCSFNRASCAAADASALLQTTDSVDIADLAAQHRDDLSQALELVPGVTTMNVGQRRERLIYVRGFNSRQVPLFIDGVPVYVPYDGNVDLEVVVVQIVPRGAPRRVDEPAPF